MLELGVDGQTLSYEEFHPYGTTAYRATASSLEKNPKRYAFTGKERDEETGLNYNGARYYASWLSRWTIPDPAGLVDGPNRYAYCRNNPVRRTDPIGEQSADAQDNTKWYAGNVRSVEQFKAWAKAHHLSYSGDVTMKWVTHDGSRSPVFHLHPSASPAARPSEPQPAAVNEATAQVGTVARDAQIRSDYHEQKASLSKQAVAKVQAASAADDLPAAREAARKASKARDVLRTATQDRQSPVGRALSQAIEKPPKTFESRVALKTVPGEAPGFNTYESIAKGVAVGRDTANGLATATKIVGGIGLAVGVGISIYNVATAKEGQLGRTAAKESGGLLGGLGLGLYGGFAGELFVTLLAAATPAGWAVFAGALVGSLVLGYFGARGGRELFGNIYDRLAQ